MKKILSALILTLATTGVAQGDPVVVWQQSGFDQPESVVSDDGGAFLYVSSIHGQPGEKDGRGYISKLTSDGRMIERRWVDGLNAPKGMGIHEGRLFVTDIDRFLVIDVASGEVLEQFSPSGAQFLNDVAVDDEGGRLCVRHDGQCDLPL